MAQKTDLNVAPYYDDFKEDKNFHRVLFRPGFAVQARELTQLQSILQLSNLYDADAFMLLRTCDTLDVFHWPLL